MMDITNIDFAKILKESGRSDGQEFKVKYSNEKLDDLLVKHGTCGGVLSDLVIAEEFKIDIKYSEILSDIFKIKVAELVTDQDSMTFLVTMGENEKLS